ncbi:MAG: sugar phosphate isomerase/epimerase [Candidatus Omnitrophica bacterium]|nr:sugar phosphate isomerase/epimerase [Candidatus Omnitrophota bacterium]
MKLKLGVIISFEHVENFDGMKELGFETCQISCWNPEIYTEENASVLREKAEKSGVQITAIWAGWPGPAVWNFFEGPLTLGLVPLEYRYVRAETLKKASGFAKTLNVQDVITHVGFIPENPDNFLYRSLIPVLCDIVGYLKNNNQFFNFETGQETPTTLFRTIHDIQEMGLNNVGINLDPANLVLYGKANPVDALDLLGKYVRGVHIKDGEYPTDGVNIGREKPVGEGRVNFSELIKKLKNFNYKGALTIEREISGPQQKTDILKAKKFLTPLL